MLDERVTRLACSGEFLTVEYQDGRMLTVPMTWFPTLATASVEARNAWYLSSDRRVIVWPEIDFSLPCSTLLRGPVAVSV